MINVNFSSMWEELPNKLINVIANLEVHLSNILF